MHGSKANADNAVRIVAALDDFGFGGLGLTAEDFQQDDRVVQLGYPPYRIDILTAVDGVRFDDAWPRRISVAVGGQDLAVIGREDLIANKQASDRPQDRADVARLVGVDGSHG